MKWFTKSPDGGEGSGVTGYFLLEWKAGFSIVLLHFEKGTREAYHSHAFNAYTIWLKGKIREHLLWWGKPIDYKAGNIKYTSRDLIHKVEALEPSWALSFRGPWSDEWTEYKDGKIIRLTHGRKVI
jgi:quercetin dioxygenase-like cupin family protein